jgi:hypothetical protein
MEFVSLSGGCYSLGCQSHARECDNDEGRGHEVCVVWEWCEDVYLADGYSQHQRHNPVHLGNGPGRVFRGASWSSEARDIRCANRYYSGPEGSYNNLGFRLLWTQ